MDLDNFVMSPFLLSLDFVRALSRAKLIVLLVEPKVMSIWKRAAIRNGASSASFDSDGPPGYFLTLSQTPPRGLHTVRVKSDVSDVVRECWGFEKG